MHHKNLSHNTYKLQKEHIHNSNTRNMASPQPEPAIIYIPKWASSVTLTGPRVHNYKSDGHIIIKEGLDVKNVHAGGNLDIHLAKHGNVTGCTGGNLTLHVHPGTELNFVDCSVGGRFKSSGDVSTTYENCTMGKHVALQEE